MKKTVITAVAAAATAAFVVLKRREAAADAEADLWAEATDPLDDQPQPGDDDPDV